MNDLSKLSDDELKALYARRPQAPASDVSKLSDEELKTLYALRQGAQAAPAEKQAPQMTQRQAALLGGVQGASFNLADEAAGLAAASGPFQYTPLGIPVGTWRMAAEKVAPSIFGDSATKRYDDTVAKARELNKAAKEENPWTYGLAEFGGGMGLPVGAAGQGIKAMAKTGAGVGAVSGYGSGEGAADSAVGAGVGTLAGGIIGGGLPLAAKGVSAAANMTGVPGLVRGATNPARQAEREVAEAFSKDARGPSPRLDASDIQAAQRDFQPVVVADMGGESVRNLARTANNLSDEAGASLKSVTQSRYDDQSTRFRDFFDDMYGGPGSLNNTRLTDDLRDAASRVNQGAYGAANRAAGGVSLWDDKLHALAQSPSVYRAMQGVDDIAAERAVREGVQPIRNPFTRDPETGYLSWKTSEDGSTVTPNLEYWDAVKINLDDQISALERAGEYGRARDIKANRDALKTHLDNLVPEYAAARAGAAQFFKADDALEAGQKFLSSSRDIAITDAAKALKAMSPEERELFERGFVTELMRKTQGRDGVDVVKVFDNQTMRDKIGMVMGDQRAAALESFVRRERIMNYLKNAVQGNSTTAKQLAAAGVLGGAGGAGIGGDPFSISVGSVMGALSNYGRLKIKEKVAREIADILTSTDPTRINQIIAQSEEPGRILQGLRSFEKAVTRGSSMQSGSGASAAVNLPVAEDKPAFASGGFVDMVEKEIRKRVMGDEPPRYAEGGKIGVAKWVAKKLSGIAPDGQKSAKEIEDVARRSGDMTYGEIRRAYDDLGLSGHDASPLVEEAMRSQPETVRAAAASMKLADQETIAGALRQYGDSYEGKPVRELLFADKLPGFRLPSFEASEASGAAADGKKIRNEITRATKAVEKEYDPGILYDLSPGTLNRRPEDVPQFFLPRAEPKVSKRLEGLDGVGARRLGRYVEEGGEGASGWYNLQQLRNDYRTMFGPQEGDERFRLWTLTNASTSMTNPIESNIRTASWYLRNALDGKPLPEPVKVIDPNTGRTVQTLAGGPPAPYGAKAQIQHAQRTREFLGGALDPIENPKPVSYQQNLLGNWKPITSDTHYIRDIVGKDRYKTFGEDAALLPGEYAWLEDVGRGVAKRRGLDPAQMQAAAWVGGGKDTGLKSEPIPYLQALEKRVAITSKVRGESPDITYDKFLRGEIDLYARGGKVKRAAPLGALSSVASGYQPSRQR